MLSRIDWKPVEVYISDLYDYVVGNILSSSIVCLMVVLIWRHPAVRMALRDLLWAAQIPLYFICRHFSDRIREILPHRYRPLIPVVLPYLSMLFSFLGSQIVVVLPAPSLFMNPPTPPGGWSPLPQVESPNLEPLEFPGETSGAAARTDQEVSAGGSRRNQGEGPPEAPIESPLDPPSITPPADLTLFNNPDNLPWFRNHGISGPVLRQHRFSEDAPWCVKTKGYDETTATSYVIYHDGRICDTKEFLRRANPAQLEALRSIALSRSFGQDNSMKTRSYNLFIRLIDDEFFLQTVP